MGLPSWFDSGQDRTKQNRRSRAQERGVAKKVGGRVMPGSGSSWRARGDVKSSTHLIEVKYTDKASFPLKKATWQQIERDALKAGKEPALIIDIQGLRLVVTAE